MDATQAWFESSVADPRFGAAPIGCRVRLVAGKAFATLLPSHAARTNALRHGFATLHLAALMPQLASLAQRRAAEADVDFFLRSEHSLATPLRSEKCLARHCLHTVRSTPPN